MCLCHICSANLIITHCSGDVIMLRISALSANAHTHSHTHTHAFTCTHTHRPGGCLWLWSVTGPLLSHWSVGGVEEQRTQLPSLFFLLLYCFLPKKRRTKDCRAPSPTSPLPPTDPLLLGRTGLWWAGGLNPFEGWLLNSWLQSSLSSQLTLVCLQWIQLEPYSWVTSRGGVHVGGWVTLLHHIRPL